MTYVPYLFIGLALILCTVRLVRGPSAADRVAALDLMAIAFAGMISTYAVLANQAIYYDIVLILSLFAFFATVAVGRFLEGTK